MYCKRGQPITINTFVSTTQHSRTIQKIASMKMRLTVVFQFNFLTLISLFFIFSSTVAFFILKYTQPYFGTKESCKIVFRFKTPVLIRLLTLAENSGFWRKAQCTKTPGQPQTSNFAFFLISFAKRFQSKSEVCFLQKV